MDAAAALVNAIPLLVVTVLGGWLLKDRFDRLESRIEALDVKIEARPTRDEMNARFERVESEVAALRSDLTLVALAVGAQTRPQTG
ncbi:MAG TPA: hypothetical protein VFA34_17075 [Actinomycetota bacterium]|nr:hypothetical protein [Actinomycetota bacterium]